MVLMVPKGAKATRSASSPSSKLILPMYILRGEERRGEEERRGGEEERGGEEGK